MANPPAGSSLLFGALADSGQIKQRKNGSYRMVLKGVDEIDWFTDRPFRSEGLWKPQKLIRQWDSFFETSDPNAQASFKVDKERELITFEMFKPKYNSKKQILSFKMDAGIINNRESDLVTGLKGKALDEVTLFIDDATLSGMYSRRTDLTNANLRGAGLTGARLNGANLNSADLTRAGLTRARLIYADLHFAVLTGAEMTGADLTGANLISTNLRGTNLSDADLNGAIMYGTDLTGATLNGAVLNDAAPYGATLIGADLIGATLNGANLTNANLINANLTNATSDSNTTWPTAEYWNNTTCPDGTNSNNNPSCGF